VFFRLFVLFVMLPLVELALLIRIGQWLGVLPTVAVVVVTGALGAFLARREGFRVLRQIQADLAAGRAPMGRLVDGLLVLVGGVVLLTPGILTDIGGILLLLPGGRGWVKRRLERRLRRMAETGSANIIGIIR
jgi:UPF0716 protein FxsA